MNEINVLLHIVKTAVAVAFMLGVLVVFHEAGHFAVAKLLGMRVDEFAFGFGPKWIRLFKRGDTEYTIHPIPLGGFVKLAGAEPGEEDVPGGFNAKPWWARLLVYLSGPVMSFVLAYLIFCTLGFTVGLPISAKALNRVELVQPKSIAERAGLRIGDVVTSVNGTAISDGNQLVRLVHGSIGKPLDFTILRGGTELHIHATPAPTKIGGRIVGAIGFMPKPVLTRVGLFTSVKYGTLATVNFVKTFASVVFSPKVKDAVGGPIAIVMETNNSLKRGVGGFMEMMAILSLSLGIINLLPIPVVDGGQMVLLTAEGIKGRRLSPLTLEIAQKIGLSILAMIFMLVMYMDLNRLLSR